MVNLSSSLSTTTGLRPEIQLLLACARTRTDPLLSDQIRTLIREENPDWDYLLRLAGRQGTLPLLYRQLNSCLPQHAAPEPVMQRLQQQVTTNTKLSFFLTRELLALLEFFEEHGIMAMPYKGPVLAATVYGNVTLRQFTDLDILVRQQDVPAAKALLIPHGYRLVTPAEPAREAEALQARYDYQFLREDGRVPLELHWAFAPDRFFYPLEIEQVWARAQTVALAGSQIRCLAAEDSLLILTVHLAQHCWRGTERLKWICDIAELVRGRPGLDWTWVLNQANRLGSRRMLYLGLFLSRDLLQAPLPPEVWAKVQADDRVRAMAGHVRQRLADERSPRLHGAERYAFYVKMRERWGNRLRRSADLVRAKSRPNQRDQETLPLPRSLQFLHYLTRPFRLLWSQGLEPLRTLIKNLI